MARYISDQNSTSILVESGTYGSASGNRIWVGMVQNSEIDENTNNIDVRYLGTGDRNVDLHQNGPLDYNVSFSYYPQDWRMMVYALGSCVDAGSPSPYTHVISESNSASGNAFTGGTKNPFMSFTWEEAQKGAVTGSNFIRTIQGVMVNSLTLNAAQGEVISVDIEGIGQSGTFTSGAITLPTANGSRPFIWEDVLVHIPSGTVYDTAKSLTLTINNNIETAHYLNGSRTTEVPIPLNRDYEVSMTLDANSENTKTLYTNYFLPGSEFNMMVEITDKVLAGGSRDAFFIFSGCKVTDMSAPSSMEGVNEQEITIVPKNLIINVDDLEFKYNPW